MEKNKITQIVQELKKHYIFRNYWSNDIWDGLNDNIELRYEPTEYIGYYKDVKTFRLDYIGDLDELRNSVAKFELVFTSTNSIFNLEKAIDITNAREEIHAINSFVKIYNSENHMIYSNEFTLWDNKPEKISGYSNSIEFFKEKN